MLCGPSGVVVARLPSSASKRSSVRLTVGAHQSCPCWWHKQKPPSGVPFSEMRVASASGGEITFDITAPAGLVSPPRSSPALPPCRCFVSRDGAFCNISTMRWAASCFVSFENHIYRGEIRCLLIVSITRKTQAKIIIWG
ncbi:hypothetical protein O181_031021 [Austropuccinia psidii MF-1]|uniref:Uncharacterized protein n=1 Tax=Austropuccinia psidii MF-1 TaxID=1389203 RepID=A0A9Q3H4T1_9BASI|nr:hypothetical protein [Austropuccinia psidii MF-1]